MNAVATAVIFHIDHVSTPVSPFIRFSPLSLRPGVVGVCFEEPGRMLCLNGDPGWGSSLAGSSVLCFLLVFLPAICGCLLFGLCVPPLVLWGFLVCCWRLPSPLTVVSLPLRLFPCGVLVQLLCWSLPLGIWFLHVTARLPWPNAWVLWCFVSSLHLASWQQRHLALCGVLCYPLHHVLLLCSVLLR